MPFIVRWPGYASAGMKNHGTVLTSVDMLPTLCAAAGVLIEPLDQGDGENLLPAFQGKAITRTKPIFWKWTGKGSDQDYWPRLAVRDGDWKLVLTEGAKRVELFHLQDDRSESMDVAKNHPDIVARLSALSLKWSNSLPDKPNPNCIAASAGSRAEGSANVKP